MANQPTLVFVPGSWHKPSCYDKIINFLREEHELKCVAITLPSTTGNRDATFKDDIDAARTAISSETTQGRDVVVIAHSYGGMVGNSAIKGFTRSRQPPAANGGSSQTSTTGHVIGLILIASGFTITGVGFMDPFFGRPPFFFRINSQTGYAELTVHPQTFFYHDLPAEEADYWTSQLSPQSLKSLFEGGEHAYAGWLDVPTWYMGTIEDVGLPVALQRVTVGMARGMGGDVEHRELQTSHSPFLSKPEETAGIVAEAVGAFVDAGKVARVTTANGGKGKAIAVRPACRLGQPTTWYRFGLPLGFGHVLGWCVLAFGRARRMWKA